MSVDGEQVTSEHIPIDRPVPFLRLPESGDMRLTEVGDHLTALGLQRDLPINERPFVQIRLARNGLPVNKRTSVTPEM